MRSLLASISLAAVPSAQELYFSAEVETPVPVFGALDGGLVEDVDGDGNLDAVVWDSGPNFALLLGDGRGAFRTASAQLGGVADCREAVFADVEGDGDRDLVRVGLEGTSILLADGSGSFALDAAPSPFAPNEFVFALASDDFNGDGLDDVIEFTTGSAVVLYVGDGSGGFSDAQATFSQEPFGYSKALSGDLDNDGDADLVTRTLQAPWIHLNDGQGNFPVATTPYTPGMPVPRGHDLGDVDLDGDLDVLVGATASNPFFGVPDRLLINDGAGVYTMTTLPDALGEARDVALDDLDGDGDLDAFVAHVDGDTFLGDGQGNFTLLTDSLSGPELRGDALVGGDYDQDGDVDYLSNCLESQQMMLLYNDGTARFTGLTAPFFSSTDTFTEAVSLGDYDADGDPDLAMLSSGIGEGTLELYRNDGTGALSFDGVAHPIHDLDVQSAETADLNQDGHLDIFVGTTRFSGFSFGGLANNFLYLGDGTGAFTLDNVNVPFTHQSTWEVLLGDVDLDGDLDALQANSSNSTDEVNELWINQGGGVFVNAPSQLPASPGHSFCGELGDFDGDGDLDAVLGGGRYSNLPIGQARNRYYENDGSGHFSNQTGSKTPAQFEFTRAIESTDVDGDGDLDLVLANSIINDVAAPLPSGAQPQPDRLWLNDGSGAFSDVTGTQLPLVNEESYDVVVLDLDGDLDLDLRFVSPSALPWGGGRVYLNDGLGNYTEGAGEFVGSSFDNIEVADLDLDGDLDMVNWHSVAWNTTRHLTWRAAPGIGNSIAFDVRGPQAGDPWTVAYSAAPLQVPVAPFGVLQLNPFFGYGVLGSGLLDADRKAQPEAPIPNAPALVGSTLYLQAIVGSPLRLTNRTVLTLQDL